MFFGFGEWMLKLFLVVFPSVLILGVVYLIGKETMNKRTAILTTILTSFCWSLMFWSSRFQPDFFSVLFQLIGIFFLIKMFNEEKQKYAIWAGVFAAIGFYFKISALLVPLAAGIFALFKDGKNAFGKKTYWICILAYIITMAPFMIWQYINFGNPAAFAPSYIGGTGIGQGWDYGWMTLNFYYIFPKNLFFAFFLIGILSFLGKNLIMADEIIKNPEMRKDNRIFFSIILIVLTLFYIFYIRGTIEDRWVFLMIPFIFYFASDGLFKIFDFIYNKKAIIAYLFLILCIFAYIVPQIQHDDALVKNKMGSYMPVKEISEYVKENTAVEDSWITVSYTEGTTYSEREVITPAPMSGEVELNETINKRNPRYIMISIFEPHSQWLLEWIQKNQYRLIAEKAYFADAEQKQLVAILYKIKY
jgi:predicted membrane protein